MNLHLPRGAGQVLHREYSHPGPAIRSVGPDWAKVIYWGHCDDTRPHACWAAGDPRVLVLRWHRLTAYLRLRPRSRPAQAPTW